MPVAPPLQAVVAVECEPPRKKQLPFFPALNAGGGNMLQVGESVMTTFSNYRNLQEYA